MSNIKAVRKTVYKCTVCGAEYRTLPEALKYCGSYELEPAEFKVGDKVVVWYANKYRAAEVIKVVGPVVGNSFKDGWRRFSVGAHVYMYRVKPSDKKSEVKILADLWTSNLRKH